MILGTVTVAVVEAAGAAGAGAGAGAGFAIRGVATVAVETVGAAGAGAGAGLVILGTVTVAVVEAAGAAGAGAGVGTATGFAFSRGMDTVFVGETFSPSSAAGIGLAGSGFVIFPIGAVLVDMNFGGSSTGAAFILRFISREGGGTDRPANPETGAAGSPPAPLPEAGISGFSLIVFLAADEADAVFADTGILFKAEVSVLRIFNGSLTPSV